MNLLLISIQAVVSDIYFFPAMAFTSIVGIFIGAVIYNGEIKEIKKAILSIFCYMALILSVNLTRIVPLIKPNTNSPQPLAGVATVLLVTIFYLFGMFLGVRVTRFAHK